MGKLTENSIFRLFHCPAGCRPRALTEMPPSTAARRHGTGQCLLQRAPSTRSDEQRQIPPGAFAVNSKRQSRLREPAAVLAEYHKASVACIVNELQNS